MRLSQKSSPGLWPFVALPWRLFWVRPSPLRDPLPLLTGPPGTAGDEFRTKASKYLTDALSKGVPSIFADVKSLYSDASKRDIIGDLVENYRKSLEATHTYGIPLTADVSEGQSFSSHILS